MDRISLRSSYSFAFVSQSFFRSMRNFSSSPSSSFVSSRSFFKLTICTATSPARSVFASIASVAAAISFSLAATKPSNSAMASFSTLVMSLSVPSMSSWSCLRMPRISPEAGAYPAFVDRKAVDALVVLVGRARCLVVQDQFINTGGLADGALALGAGPDDLVAADLGHLRRPLARAAPDAMNQHPLARLDELRVRVRREVVRREALDGARHSHVHRDIVRHR